jgi:peptidyl-prolyl cis-trans isomerase D
VAEKLNLQVKESPFISKGAVAPAPLNNPKLQAEIFSESTLKGKRNTAAVEVAPNIFVAARLLEQKPSELSSFDSVKAAIEKRIQRERATRLAADDGNAKLKELLAGKDAGLKWPAPLAVNRQKPGGLFPQVIDKVFRVDAKKLPAYLGLDTPAGFALVQVSKVIEPEKIDDNMRTALGGQLKEAVAAEELEATLASLRDKVGVRVSREALEPKTENP